MLEGHLHDGGTHVVLKQNGKVVCDSHANYGGPGATVVNADGSKWETIATMSVCQEPIEVKKGDTMKVISHYDMLEHPA